MPGVYHGRHPGIEGHAPGGVPNTPREEANVVQWLAPIALFWTMIAMYLGGFPLKIEGGNGPKHLLGLVLTFALYLVAWWGLRAGFNAITGPIPAVVFACLAATLLLPSFTKGAYRLVGVRITRAAAAH